MALDALVAVLLALPVWLMGTVVFDTVHWVLHLMLRSPWGALRLLAWPHGVHHRWLDRQLRIRPEYQRQNVFCHLVPEYLTQIAFSAGLLLILPVPVVLATATLQTAIFLFLLSQKGLDINHRTIDMLDAYQPSWWALPAYHAWHHVHPDAYYSAYTKVVDYVVGGGIELRGRIVSIQGSESAFGRALRERLKRAGVGEMRAIESPGEIRVDEAQIVVLSSPAESEPDFVERLAHSTRAHQLPSEIWAVHTRPEEPVARHYYHDVRVIYRTIVVPKGALDNPMRARRAAALATFFLRRGVNYVPASLSFRVLFGVRRFRRIRPERPEAAPRIRHRSEVIAA